MRAPRLLVGSTLTLIFLFASDGLAQVATPSAGDEQAAEAAEGRAPTSKAPPGIEEIVIQAGESDAASDFEAGDSVAAFDASDLEALGAQSVADLAAFTPNLEIVTAGATTPTFFIRGVGLNDFNANSSGAVAIYQDDVPKNSPALQLGTLFDVEAVNILRGPQGTGPYRNASAGAIKIYSRRPSGNYGAYLNSSYGNYDYMDFEGAVEAPVFEDILTSRFSFRFTDRAGTMTNGCGDAIPVEERVVKIREVDQARATLCGDDVPRRGDLIYPVTQPLQRYDGRSIIPEGLPTRLNDTHNWAGRGVLLFQPTLDSEWQLTVHGGRRDERARIGQSYGTTLTVYDQDCLESVPIEDLGDNTKIAQCRIRGNLGGDDAKGYQPFEVTQMIRTADACLDDETGAEIRTGECATYEQRLLIHNAANLEIANTLGRRLDDDPYHADVNTVGPVQNDVWGVSLKGDAVLGNSVYMSLVSSYDTYDRLNWIDLDFSPNQLFEVRTNDHGWQLTQDLQFSGQLSEEIPLRWTVGAFYLQEVLDVGIDNFFPSERLALGLLGRKYIQDLYSVAGYFSFEWDFWDDFTLDGGVRYNWERKVMDYTLVRNTSTQNELQERTWQAPTGTLRLTYRFREDTHAYWKYTRGWKGGHFNATSSQRQGVTAAEPEEIDAFEFGLRGSWFEGRLGANFSLFHYNYNNYQIFTAQQQLNAQPEFVILNANNAEIYGSELDLVARPLPGMYLQARLAWLDSQFLKFIQRQQTQAVFGFDAVAFDVEVNNTGNPLLNSPRFKVSLTAEQMIPLGRFGSLTARYDGAWTDTVNYDATDGLGIPNAQGNQFLPEGTIGQNAYWVHNLRLGYRTPAGNIEIAGWVRNLTNQVYKTFAFDGSTFQNTTLYFVGDPRTYGLTVTTTF